VAKKKEVTEPTQPPAEEAEVVELDTGSVVEEEAPVAAMQAEEAAEEAEAAVVAEAEAPEVEEVSEVEAAPEVEATVVAEAQAPEVGEIAIEEAAPVAEEVAPDQEVEAEEPAPVFEKPVRQGDVYYYGTGRRKTSSAQVRLYPSKEPGITVNDLRVDEYFSREADVVFLKTPLRVTATEDMFRISVKVRGGGVAGQAGAVRHGIARALTKANPELRPTLRREGSLTRDPRMKERKKPGLKRARKAPQYTKR
jgi:small subunit ribosomal protein S9